MDWIRVVHEMPGPLFLLLYGVVILATLAMCKFWAGRHDATRNLPTPPVPNDFDPA